MEEKEKMTDNDMTIRDKEKIGEQLEKILLKVREALGEVEHKPDVMHAMSLAEALHARILGKKGELTKLLRVMNDIPKEDRPPVGILFNAYRQKIEDRMNDSFSRLQRQTQEQKFKNEKIDVTLPGIYIPRGKLHPITQIYRQLRDIFVGMGFCIEDGPEIEWVELSFDKLNIPHNHPARDFQDTFYIDEKIALRPHTSPVQIRSLLKKELPLRMICPGRVFRPDDVDATHSPVFNQMEGMVIDKGISMGDLMGVLSEFLHELYGSDTKIRFRPSFFPFTEPSTEVDIACVACGGKGCRVCKGGGWIEILGGGMVHPNVLRATNVDPDIYSGFAFGIGLDRITTLKYGISDIRLLYENDIRFLEQF